MEKLNEKGHLTAEKCWEAYVEQAKKSGKTSYSRSAFYWKLKQELKAKEFTLVMLQQRSPGQYLEFDFAGDVIHTADGKKLRVFVASLGWSKLIYAKVVKDIRTASWIEGLIGCFEYIGGLPEVILSDNDVALVTSSKRGSKALVKSYQDCLDYYGLEAEVARVRKPRDKGLCENAVRIVENQFLKKITATSIKTIEDAHNAKLVKIAALDSTVIGTPFHGAKLRVLSQLRSCLNG